MIAEMTVQFLPKFIFDVTDSKRDVNMKDKIFLQG